MTTARATSPRLPVIPVGIQNKKSSVRRGIVGPEEVEEPLRLEPIRHGVGSSLCQLRTVVSGPQRVSPEDDVRIRHGRILD